MATMTLEIGGYVQCRLATDPDPTDERRGVSGYTFALPGEPDLDWTIHTQQGPGVIQRLGVERVVGVQVQGGLCGNEPIAKGHPLHGAPVFLEDNPRFEERNYVVTRQQFGVVAPFKLRIKGDGIEIFRQVYFDPSQVLDTPVIEVPQATLQPFTSTYFKNYPACFALLGSAATPTRYREVRRETLEHVKRTCALRPDAMAALDKRIEELRIDDPMDRRSFQLLAATVFQFPINGPASLKLGGASPVWLNGRLDAWGKGRGAQQAQEFPDWPCRLWFGSWDADSLTMWMGATVVVQDLGHGFLQWLAARRGGKDNACPGAE